MSAQTMRMCEGCMPWCGADCAGKPSPEAPVTEPPKWAPMTPEHDADVAYYQREVWHIANSIEESHPERNALLAEVKRLGELRKLIRLIGGFTPCGVHGTSMCCLLAGHGGLHAWYETPMWVHVEEAE